jgi:beta-1,4-N-acetylglucosaminyltransferase
MKVLFVCSSGGHLDQVMALLPAPSGVDVAVATFHKPDAVDKLRGFRTYPLAWPTNRSISKTLQNALIAVRVLRQERPDVVISTGAAAAVPFFFIAKIFRVKTIYIECVDRVSLPTVTARLVRPVTDAFVTQWRTQLPNWPRRVELGRSR